MILNNPNVIRMPPETAAMIYIKNLSGRNISKKEEAFITICKNIEASRELNLWYTNPSSRPMQNA
jgi:hypothetical protein